MPSFITWKRKFLILSNKLILTYEERSFGHNFVAFQEFYTVAQPSQILGGFKYFDSKRATVFCLWQRLSKHKRQDTLEIWGEWPPWTLPGYAYGSTCASNIAGWIALPQEIRDQLPISTYKMVISLKQCQVFHFTDSAAKISGSLHSECKLVSGFFKGALPSFRRRCSRSEIFICRVFMVSFVSQKKPQCLGLASMAKIWGRDFLWTSAFTRLTFNSTLLKLWAVEKSVPEKFQDDKS